jgi:putative ABC transport system permease protein
MLKPKYIPFAIKQIVRHPTRSSLTVAGVAVAMFLFCGVQAMQAGAEAATQAAASDNTLVVYRKDRYCPFASRLPQSYLERVTKIPGVAAVVPMQIVVTNCRASLDVITFRGVPEDRFQEAYGQGLKFLAGSFDEWERRSDAVLLGETLAARRGLKVGESFDAVGIRAYVAGIIAATAAQHENVAYAHLSFLQAASGSRAGGIVTQFNVRITDPQQLDAVATAIDAEFAHDQEPTHTRSEKAFVASAAKDVLEIVGFTRWLGWGCLLAVLGLVGNAIVLAVMDRVREHAILQTLGYKGGLIARLILTESVLLSLAGGVLGSLIAALFLRWGRFSLSVEGISISVGTEPVVFVTGLLIAVILGALAGLFPAWQASRRPIAECFRAV